jgi:SnoaL-like protein
MAARKAKKKSVKRAKPAKKSAPKKKSAASMAPKPVKTGKGATPLDIAKDFAALIRAGKSDEVEKKWLAPGIESVEGVGASMAWSGKKAVLAKYRGWEADHEIHSMTLEGPWVGATGFALRFSLDATQLSTGQRHQMHEIAVYTVRNGKVVREEFHFALPG